MEIKAEYKFCKLSDLYLENNFKLINQLRVGKVINYLPIGTIETTYKPYKDELRKLKNEEVIVVKTLDGIEKAYFRDEEQAAKILGRPKIERLYNNK